MPSQIKDHADRILAAAADGTPLRWRGGGTKDFYGQALIGEVVDTRSLAGITAYEPSELVITAGAGTPLAEVEAVLAAQGQCFAFEPPHFAQVAGSSTGATLGGMVAAGLAGPARAAVGTVRDFVLGLELLNGRAEHLVFGGQVMKNVAGYDVSRLLAGSMGTLGLITSVSLKVLPVAPAEASLRFEFDSASALRQLNEWAGQPLPINASCFLDGVLTVRLRGAQAAVQAAVRRLGGQLVPEVEAQALWSALREQTHPFFALTGEESLWRVSVPDTAPPLGVGQRCLMEWGGAQRWYKVTSQDAPDTAAQLRERALQWGGHATKFRGHSDLPVFTPATQVLQRVQRDLQKQFDPAGIFCRQRLET
jgi:glycolate oxidase FAD binding subunit